MSSKGKRSSILKRRPSVGAGGSLESSPTETTATGRATKRIGFKPKKSVKEFFASDETATIWCNSYELSAEGTPLHVTINDTTVKDGGEPRQDKENVEDNRRNSINSSAWNLSVSVSEEEKRRMKSEISMNSSVLNVTDRLTLEPAPLNIPPRPVLAQKQTELVADSSAMDVSPAKVSDGRHNSPRKTIYFHPKQNMFITIDDVVSNDRKTEATTPEQQPSPNDTDINFFGPPRQSSLRPPEAVPAKVLFQTSSSTSMTPGNPWRNKSVQTSDISAGWTSHAGIDPPPNQPRYTFYNSQFEISEAWNSHPAAALKLRMLQQGLEPPPDFNDPRLSGGGGGGSGRTSDVDTTLAITQTVAKMLRPSMGGGSRTVSLDSTRASEGGGGVEGVGESEPEAMEVTSWKDTTHHVDIPMQTDDDDDDDDRHQRKPPLSVEASPSDVLLPPNALSRARPSFIPSGNAADITMDESYCPPSPEPVKLEACDSKRNTLAVPVPMEVLAAAPPSRQTILNEEKIVLDVPNSRLNPVRHTVFGAQMELAVEKEEERKRTALPQMETIKVDLADLVFARNSIGLDLVPVVATPAEANRPKIHRIAPRALGFNFGEATPSTSGSVKPVEAPKQTPRVTIYSGDVVEQTRIEEVDVREPRKTIVQSLDVSMASPVEEPSAPKTRGTVFVSEDVNESVVEPAVKQNHLRPTMLFNEKLEVSKLEPRSGSLEDLRRYGQSRKSILSSGDDVIIVLDSPDVTGRMSLKSGHRGTLLVSGDMDRTRRTPSPVEQQQEQVVSKSRQTMANAVSMEQTMAANSSISPVTVPSRITVYDADGMDETRIKDMISPEVFVQPVAPKSRQTCYQAEMDETVPIGRSVDAVPNPSRKSVLHEVNMDETRGVGAVQQQSTLQKARQTSFAVQDMNETRVGGQPVEMDETARTANRTLQKSRQTSFAVQDMNRTASPDVSQSVTQHVGMDETCRKDALEQSKASRTLPKSRQTSFAAQDMNVTRTGSPVDQQQDALEQSKASRTLPKSRQTSFAAQNMNVTRAASPVDQQVAMDETGRASKSRQTSFAVQDMNQTGRPSVVQQVEADSGLLQKSRQTNFTAQDVNETGVIQQVDKSSRALEKSRQTSYAAQDMNRSLVVAQHVEMDESLRPDPLEQSKASRTLQKSRQTSFAVQDMNETRARSSPSKLEIDETAQTFNRMLQKSRQTSFAVQDMNQTGRVSPNLRQSEVEMGGNSPAPAWQLSRSQFATSSVDPLEQSKALQKSRQTSFAVEQMDQTLAGHAKSVVVEHLQKSNRQTVYQEAEMEQTRRDFGNHLEVDDQNTRLSRLEHSRASRIPRHTSFAVQDMNETGVERNGSEEVATKSWQLSKSTLREEVQKARQTSFSAENMDETSVESSRLQKTSSNISNLQKSRQTTFQPAEMDQTRCQSPLHIEETILQSPQRADDPQASQAPSLFHSTNHSTVVERTRQTAIFNDGDDADDGYGTVPIGQQQQVVATSFSSPHLNLEQSIKRHSVAAASSRPRHTIYAQESMEETTVGMARISDGCRLVVEEEERQKRTPPPAAVEKVGVAAAAKSRKTVYCEDDMEQTTVGFRLRRVAEVESPVFKEPSPVKERAPSPEVINHVIIPSQPIRSRQTILAPQDMEQSLMQQSMEVSVIKSTPRKAEVSHQQQHPHHPPRRTIMLSEGITEESFQQPERPFKLEQTASPCPSDQDYEESLTVELKQEDKSDFSFTMPALPEDRVLRSSAVIPAYRMAPVGRIGPTGKSLVPEELNTTDLLVPQGGRMFPGVVRVPMDELSEISGLADTSRLCRPARPVSMLPGDVSSFALLKEVTEPSILHPVDVVVPSVPTSVIQETPRKTSMIPVARRSRGSIFNRQSVDMDMSGVTVMEGGTPESEEKGVEEVEIEVPIEPEPTNLNASEEDEFYDAETNPVLEEREVPVAPTISDQSTMMHMDVNQTAAGLKTLKFIDVDELEQTTAAWPQQQQKRLLSQISKSVLLEQEENDPLNVSLSDDYPLKKRKTVAVPTPAKDPLTVTEEDKPPRKSLRRVTFQPELELETVTIKKECDTIVEANETYAPEESRFDPSVFIVEESDMLANESNISLVVASPTAHESSSSRTTTRASTSKYDNSIYREYGNLTLNVDQLGSTSCIVISDDSITETKPTPAQLRLTLADLPKRIRKSRESLVLNSTVASEVMYELNHEVTAAKQLPQRPRRTMAAVRQETVETVREAWETNFGRILESVVDVSKTNELPLDERIREILGRPMKEALPLPQCLERGLTGSAGQLPEVPSIWFLSENFLRTTLSDAPTSSSEVFTPCHLPATPSSTTLVRNRLETQGFRWFLDSSCGASERRLYLRHRTLRTLNLVIHLQKIPSDCCHNDRIERLELVECWRQAVPSSRLLAAHAEFMEIGPKNVRDVLSSMCTSTGHLMSLVVHLDTLVEQVLGKVDALWRIVKNNGAVLEEFGTDRRLRISKYFEYQHGQTVHWNRLEVQFDAIDRIERSSVSFHRSDLHQHCASLFPTEQQCGKSGLQGLVFLECLLWNVEKLALEC